MNKNSIYQEAIIHYYHSAEESTVLNKTVMSLITLQAALAALVIVGNTQKITDEGQAWKWLLEYGEAASIISNRESLISWDYYTNLTDYNQQRMVRS